MSVPPSSHPSTIVRAVFDTCRDVAKLKPDAYAKYGREGKIEVLADFERKYIIALRAWLSLERAQLVGLKRVQSRAYGYIALAAAVHARCNGRHDNGAAATNAVVDTYLLGMAAVTPSNNDDNEEHIAASINRDVGEVFGHLEKQQSQLSECRRKHAEMVKIYHRDPDDARETYGYTAATLEHEGERCNKWSGVVSAHIREIIEQARAWAAESCGVYASIRAFEHAAEVLDMASREAANAVRNPALATADSALLDREAGVVRAVRDHAKTRVGLTSIDRNAYVSMPSGSLVDIGLNRHPSGGLGKIKFGTLIDEKLRGVHTRSVDFSGRYVVPDEVDQPRGSLPPLERHEQMFYVEDEHDDDFEGGGNDSDYVPSDDPDYDAPPARQTRQSSRQARHRELVQRDAARAREAEDFLNEYNASDYSDDSDDSDDGGRGSSRTRACVSGKVRKFTGQRRI